MCVCSFRVGRRRSSHSHSQYCRPRPAPLIYMHTFMPNLLLLHTHTHTLNRLSLLWEAITPEYKRFGQFLTGTQHNRRQVGACVGVWVWLRLCVCLVVVCVHRVAVPPNSSKSVGSKVLVV